MAIEILQGLERKAFISIKKNEINELVQQELKKHAKKAKVQGFRPGKAPMTVIEKMYKAEVTEEILDRKVKDELYKLLLENELYPASEPELALTSGEGQEFIFSALFEIMPTVVMGDLNAQTVNIPTCAIDDSMIDETIDKIVMQHATYVDAPGDKIATDFDKVTIDFVGTVDGVEFDGGSATNYSFILGQKKMLPEFEASIVGQKVSEVKEAEVNFPTDYHASHLAGKKAIFKITLRKIEVPQKPELTSEFIQKLGIKDGTIEALRKIIKENIDHEIAQQLFIVTRKRALDALLATANFDVPKALIHKEVHDMIASTKEQMKREGHKEENINLTHEMFWDGAQDIVKLRFLIQEVIKQQDIKVNDAEIKEIVKEMAYGYADQDAYIDWYYSDNDRVANAKAHAIEKKVVEYILSVVTKNEIAVSRDELFTR